MSQRSFEGGASCVCYGDLHAACYNYIELQKIKWKKPKDGNFNRKSIAKESSACDSRDVPQNKKAY